MVFTEPESETECVPQLQPFCTPEMILEFPLVVTVFDPQLPMVMLEAVMGLEDASVPEMVTLSVK
jgi:hypothetical protein